MCVCVCVCIRMHVCTHMCVCVYECLFRIAGSGDVLVVDGEDDSD